MLSVLWDRQHAGLRRAIAVALGAALMLFLLAGCSQLSEVPSAISTGLYGRVDVPAEFTVQTDTEDGTNLIYLALGGILIRVPEELRATAETNCQVFAVSRYGLNPTQGRSSGAIVTNPHNPTQEPFFGCVLDKTWERGAMAQVGQQMKPPRVVLHYDRGLRIIRYGTQRVD